MSLFSYGQGITLKELLENPKLQNPPNLNRGENKEVKKDDFSDGIDIGSAFLGPNLWGNTNSGVDDDFNLEYMDLDEFLSENGIPIGFEEGSNSAIQKHSPKSIDPPSPQQQQSPVSGVIVDHFLPHPPTPPRELSALDPPSPPVQKRPKSPAEEPEQVEPKEKSKEGKGNHNPVIDYEVNDTDLALASIPVGRQSPYNSDSDDSIPSTNFHVNQADMELVAIPGQGNFDPRRRKFTEEELKPQPIIKKSRKVYVPDECKDDKYWCRRKKNNVAAKRSRDARRIKENQIAMRAAFLEKENGALREELKKIKEENSQLRKTIQKYES
ncbi:hypothetical protein FSP39_001173 [Pinctada imbricata]|uniref:BZIP domain-containing protein n=1 Tax=Pinctada imbricata TaxID=66713 RepID=A0AA88YGV8_PINIB|nr:hypothetical protein FSP39_001173 [Pinctada imbricata]